MTISPDDKSIYYSIEFWPSPGTPYLLHYEYINNKWNGPDTATFSKNRMTNEPTFAFNGSRIYSDATPTLNQVGSVDLSYMNENTIDDYKLYQNYPNPFNPSTVISYALPGNSFVKLKVYNILGKEIATLVNSLQRRGVYDIPLNTNNLNLSSGVYLYTLTAAETNSGKVFKETKVMNYIK
ncbi:MAG: T9SS type A sorting domain-containing protein [Ignavibacteria bacterium]